MHSILQADGTQNKRPLFGFSNEYDIKGSLLVNISHGKRS